jgi:hypothetical protein
MNSKKISNRKGEKSSFAVFFGLSHEVRMTSLKDLLETETISL